MAKDNASKLVFTVIPSFQDVDRLHNHTWHWWNEVVIFCHVSRFNIFKVGDEESLGVAEPPKLT